MSKQNAIVEMREPSDEGSPTATNQDAADMRRLGKKQELNVWRSNTQSIER